MIPLLARLSDEDIKRVRATLVKKEYVKDTNIITQGEDGDGFYLIEEGSVSVWASTKVDGKPTTNKLCKLVAGDYFGEMALLSNSKRGATVTATTDNVKLYFQETSSFNKLFGENKLNIQFAKRQGISAEVSMLPNPAQLAAVPCDAIKEKSQAVRDLIHRAIKFNVLFMNLSKEVREKVVDEMYLQEIGEGQTVITQDEDNGNHLYVVQKGKFEVFVNGVQVAKREDGSCFGELALMYNSKRAATVKAAADSKVWVVDRFTFRRVVKGVSEGKLSKQQQFLQGVDLLSPLTTAERAKVAEALEEVSKGPGEVICKQGEDGDSMYIVYTGTLSVSKSDEVKEVKQVKEREYFGERALIKNEPRAATVTTKTACVLLRLDRNAFSLLLGPLADIMDENIQSYEKDKNTDVAEGETNTTSMTNIKFEDLKVLGTLGKGSFGFVQLVQDGSSDDTTTYALKAVSKAQIVQTGQQGHIMSEKMAMQKLQHPFMVRLFQTFKDNDRLYFLLEPSLGGELFSLLREKTFFDEDTSRFYAGHVVLTFEYMHSFNFVYRDLKPENLLVDSTGYIKVTDFGFAKDIGINGRTWTLCGTPDYLAPEIVAGKGHGKGVDWWTLGVFIYEMLASYPPFYDEEPMKTYSKIMLGSITFPAHFTREAISIVRKFLAHKATRRLGVLKGGSKLIKNNPWFKTFDFDKLYNRGYKAPHVPKIADSKDITNFDDYPAEDDSVEPYEDDGSNWDADF